MKHHFYVEHKIKGSVAYVTKSHFISMHKISLDPNKLQVLIGVSIYMFVVYSLFSLLKLYDDCFPESL